LKGRKWNEWTERKELETQEAPPGILVFQFFPHFGCLNRIFVTRYSMNQFEYLTTYHYPRKLRLGKKGDGGYVIAELPGSYDCYISAGVNDEESFSGDFIRHYKMDFTKNYAFDGTIQHYPYEYTTDIHFVRKNIAGINDTHNTNLQYLIQKHDNIFLKMDIEGGEYPWLETVTEKDLLHFKQMVFELHNINDDSYGCTITRKTEYLKKLASTHYLVHAHGNNNGPGWGQNREVNGIPTVIELTYVRKDYVSDPTLNKTPLPIEGLDFKNAPYSELSLNHPPFTWQ
jgi:hypothetical protein